MSNQDQINRIITRNRFHPVSYAPFMVAYFPLGLILALLRSIIFLHIHIASFLLESIPYLRRFVVRFMCGILGFIVMEDDSMVTSLENDLHNGRTSKQRFAVVSNHLSLFDYLVMSLVRPCFTTNRKVFYWPNSCYSFDIQSDSSESLKTIIQSRSEPVHLLPECAPTGTNRVLLKFNAKYFDGIDVVRPVAIRGYRLFPVSFVVYPLSWAWELFWQFLTPFTLYKLYPLDPVTRNTDESNEHFADRVARILAAPLNSQYLDSCDSKELDRAVKTSLMNSSQSTEHQISSSRASTSSRKVSSSNLKPTKINDDHSGRPVRASPPPRVSKDMQRNIQAVMDVLPHVPYHIVLKELERSNGDVDGVITDILEERIDLTAPVPPDPPIVLDKSDQKNSPVSPCSFLAADKTFGHKAEDRHRSFQERKKLFLENARKAYLQKHNISE